MIGWDNKCWHCGGDHNRKDCRGFAKMMKDANPGVSDLAKMKPPAGYKSALAKARDAAKASAPKKKVNAIRDADDTGSEDDDEDTFSQAGRFVIRALTPVEKGTPWAQAQCPPTVSSKVCAINKFEGLDDRQEYSEEALRPFNMWAHKVKVETKKKLSQKKSHEKFKHAAAGEISTPAHCLRPDDLNAFQKPTDLKDPSS